VKKVDSQNRDYYSQDYYQKSEGINFARVPAYRHVCRAFQNRNITTFIDIGCGIGNQLKSFQGKFSNIVGIDVSVWALKKAKMSLPSQDFIAADARFLPLRNDSVDAGMCISVIEHLDAKDGKRLLEEVYKACKSKAPIVIITPKLDSLIYKSNTCRDPSHIHIYTAGELHNVLTSIGFAIKELLFSSLTPKLGIFGNLLKCDIICIVQRES
jgi:ubiquinone/menaquinone biosynthesis C-methylase UbiE